MENRREVELIDAGNLGRQPSENRAEVAALREDVHAKTRLLPQSVRTVARPALDQVFRQAAIAIDDIQSDGFRLKRRQLLDWRFDRDSHQLARGFHLERLIHSNIE